MRRRAALIGLIMALAAAGAACGGDPTESEEYLEVASERDAAATARDALAADLAVSNAEIAALDEAIKDLEEEAAATAAELEAMQEESDAVAGQNAQLQDRLDAMGLQIAELAADKAALIQERDTAVAAAEGLAAVVETGIGSELKDAWDAEVLRACEVAEETWNKPVGTLVRYEADWNVLGRKQDLIDEVQACADEGRHAAAAAAGADGPVDELQPPTVTRPVPPWE